LIPLLTIPELLLLPLFFDGLIKIIIVSVVSVLIIVPVSYVVGFEKAERSVVREMIASRINLKK
jgi:hypothetical protein